MQNLADNLPAHNYHLLHHTPDKQTRSHLTREKIIHEKFLQRFFSYSTFRRRNYFCGVRGILKA